MYNLHWCHRIHNSGDKGWGCLFLIDCNCNQILKKRQREILKVILTWKKKIDHGTSMKFVTFVNVNWPNLNILLQYSVVTSISLWPSLLLHADPLFLRLLYFQPPWAASNSSYLGEGEDEHAGAVRSHPHQLYRKREIHGSLWILLEAVEDV